MMNQRQIAAAWEHFAAKMEGELAQRAARREAAPPAARPRLSVYVAPALCTAADAAQYLEGELADSLEAVGHAATGGADVPGELLLDFAKMIRGAGLLLRAGAPVEPESDANVESLALMLEAVSPNRPELTDRLTSLLLRGCAAMGEACWDEERLTPRARDMLRQAAQQIEDLDPDAERPARVPGGRVMGNPKNVQRAYEILRSLMDGPEAFDADVLRVAAGRLTREHAAGEAAPIRAYLLADLAKWPAAFRQALEPVILRKTRTPVSARGFLAEFEAQRSGPPRLGPSEERRQCGCGCEGRNSQLGRLFLDIRETASDARGSRARWLRSYVKRRKHDLLEWMWLAGWRRIDRLAVGQHAVEAAKAEMEELTAQARIKQRYLERVEWKVAEGIYLRGPRKGQPWAAKDRKHHEEWAERLRASLRPYQARLAELQRLVSEDVPSLVREFTGCTRQAAGRAQ